MQFKETTIFREKKLRADIEKENDVDDKNDWGTELTRQQLLGIFSSYEYRV